MTHHQQHMAPCQASRLVGGWLASYRLDTLIGQGAMSWVYRATSSERQSEKVAVKVLRPDRVDDSISLNSFLAEARLGEQFEHPALVPVLWHGYAQCFPYRLRMWYLVQDFCPGITLRQYLRQEGHLPERDVWCIALQLADTLQYVHGLGVIHRDISPENIMVSSSELRVRLLDFGCAVSTDRFSQEQNSIVAGRLPYVAPEHVLQENGLFDGRADMYSLGVVLWELLVGYRPYGASSYSELAAALDHFQVCPRPRIVVESVLCPILSRLLEFDPICRYSSVDDLLVDLMLLSPG